MPFMTMEHTEDPKEVLLKRLGDISKVDIFHNQIMVAVYTRPEKTKGGIILTSQTTDEDKFQSKVGLVVKMGPQAFNDPEGKWFEGVDVSYADWIVFRPSDGWAITVNDVLCRMLDDTNVRGTVDQPDRVW